MNLRELLRLELWSKETHRKILVGIGIAICLGFLGVFVWNQVEWHWLTPGERVAARTALTEIDSLQDSGTLSEQDWKARSKDAETKVEIAEAAAKTHRDAFLEMGLNWYLVQVEMNHTNVLLRAAGKRELKIEPIPGNSTKNLRAGLHKILD
jgi:hypothetical protein